MRRQKAWLVGWLVGSHSKLHSPRGGIKGDRELSEWVCCWEDDYVWEVWQDWQVGIQAGNRRVREPCMHQRNLDGRRTTGSGLMRSCDAHAVMRCTWPHVMSNSVQVFGRTEVLLSQLLHRIIMHRVETFPFSSGRGYASIFVQHLSLPRSLPLSPLP